MFVGRSAELGKMDEMYASNTFEFAIIYGRRRVGKTTLIKEFIKDKKAIYFLAREANSQINLEGFSNDVYAVTAKESKGNAVFTDWEKAFDYIYQVAKEERIVLAIDEFPYLAGGYRPISSIVQAHIDNQLKDSKLFLILCGSSMSFMEEQVLGYRSPLYGRRTAQFKVTPFRFAECQPFLGRNKETDKALIYGFTGGIPEYLSKLDPKKTVGENIVNLFLTPSGYFFEEPSNLLKQELREPATYNGIIQAIAEGASRLNEIATKCGLESNKCAKYLKSLISLGIVRKEYPVTETPASKKSIYLLDDLMFRFWYRFVFPNMSAVTAGLGNLIYAAEIEESLSAYMGLVFEEICKQFLFEEAKKGATPFVAGKTGKWWGNNPMEKRQEEIDILMYRKESALFCECKWTNTKVGVAVLDGLMKKSGIFSYEKKWFWLFAKNGFTKELVEREKESGNVRLVSLDEMIIEGEYIRGEF